MISGSEVVKKYLKGGKKEKYWQLDKQTDGRTDDGCGQQVIGN